MAKPHKIKRYHRTMGSSGPRRNPLGLLVKLALLGALIFLGVSIYQPVMNFLQDVTQGSGRTPVEEPLPEVPAPAPQELEPEEPDIFSVNGIQAVYLPSESIGELDSFLDGLDGEINSVLVDIKNDAGQILYRSTMEQAASYEAVSADAFDLASLAQKLESRDMYLLVRMHTFSDPIGARGDRANNAIHYMNTETLWLDNTEAAGGKPWLNPYSPQAREYLFAIAEDAVAGGAKMVILQEARFPDDVGNVAGYGPAAEGTSKQEVLKEFVDEMTRRLEPLGARTAVYLPAVSIANPQREGRYGGNPLNIVGNDVLLGVMPANFGGDYNEDGLTVADPAGDPAAAIAAALEYVAATRNSGVNFISLIQARDDAYPYDAAMVRAQIAAAQAGGSGEYVLYSAAGSYPAG